MSDENAKIREVSGFIPSEVRTRNIDTKEGFVPVKLFSVGTLTEEGMDFTNVRVSDKFFESVKELRPGNKVTVLGYPKSYDYTDDEGNKQTYNFLEVAKEVSLVTDKHVFLFGNLASDMERIEFENGSKFTFKLGVKNDKPGQDNNERTFYTANVGKKHMEASDLAKKGDLVAVQGIMKEKIHEKKNEEKKERVVHATFPIELHYSKTESQSKSESKSENEEKLAEERLAEEKFARKNGHLHMLRRSREQAYFHKQ